MNEGAGSAKKERPGQMEEKKSLEAGNVVIILQHTWV
jgi:hypothetical protein